MTPVLGEERRGKCQKWQGTGETAIPFRRLDVRQFVTRSSGTDHRRVLVRLLVVDELL